MTEVFSTENLIALLTLTALEIVLGIDNIVFLSILTAKLPARLQARGRNLGLTLAMGMRIVLLLAIGWVMRLTEPLLSLRSLEFSGRDLILLAGGLFLVGKATYEIHERLEGPGRGSGPTAIPARFGLVLLQIVALDIIFSLDSVITAVGMARELWVMVTAVVVAVLVMMSSAGAISAFIERHPTMKILALSFLILVGVMLILEGLGKPMEKGFIYFAMSFSLAVELVNLRVRRAAAAAPARR
jgi:predicted tellurium resistance membrane protein TerC